MLFLFSLTCRYLLRRVFFLVCVMVWSFSTLANDARSHPALRIITLAPNLVELVFAAGAGASIVGTVDFSDYPENAKKIPRIGSYARLDLEAIFALKPDLIIARAERDRAMEPFLLSRLNVPVLFVKSDSLFALPEAILAIGMRTGTDDIAQKEAQAIKLALTQLQKTYAHLPKVPLFYQVWHAPLLTVGSDVLMNELFSLCGGENVFLSETNPSPQVSIEAVLAKDPEVIIASGMDVARPEWLSDWMPWQHLKAVFKENLFFIPPSEFQRYGPRLLLGAKRLCTQLEEARQKRSL